VVRHPLIGRRGRVLGQEEWRASEMARSSFSTRRKSGESFNSLRRSERYQK